MKNYYKKALLILTILPIVSSGMDIPINPAHKGDVSNWLFMGPIKQNTDAYELVGKIEKDPMNYFISGSENRDLEIKNIQSQIKFGGQYYYQLYKELDKGDIIFAFSQIDSRTKQQVILDNNSSRGNFEIYLNGTFVKKIVDEREETEVTLKKGLNSVLLKIYPDKYRLDLTALYHRFFFNIIPENRFEITGKLKDSKGNPLPFKNVTAWDNSVFHNTTTDDKGVYKFYFYPKSSQYQLSATNNDVKGYSKLIFGKEGGRVEYDIICNNRSKLEGRVFMLDGDSPHPGIGIVLEKIKSNENFKKWNAVTDENGKFTVRPNIGSYHLAYFSDDKKHYKTNPDGSRKIIKFDGQSTLWEEITISHQVRGSWKRINLFDGMLSNSIYDLLVGSDGLLYIATFNGFSIYDGQTVTSYNFKDGLPNSYINQLFEDADGNIWLGYEYLGVVKWRNGIVSHITHQDGLVGNSVRAINQDKDGNMLFGTERGLSIYDGSAFKNLNYSDGLGNGGIISIEVDGKNIWLGGTNPLGAFTLYNGTALKNFEIPQASGAQMHIKSIKKGEDGKIWFGDQRRGLFCYDGENFTNYTVMDGLPSNDVLDILIENNNSIWVTTNRGVALFNGETFRTIGDLDNDDALDFSESSSIAKSKDGVFFFGQGNSGVVIYDPNSLRNITKSDGFQRAPVSDIQFDNDNNLWIASWRWSGLQMLENEQIVKTVTQNDGLSSNFVNEIDFSIDGTMWIATRNGLNTYKGGKVKKVYKKSDGLPDNYVVSVAIDDNDVVWLNTLAGLTRYNGDSFVTYDEDDGLVRPRANGDVSIDKNGNIVYSTYGSGLSIFDGKTFKNITSENGLVDDRIWDIGFDSKNNYWIATDGSGVQKYDGESFTHYDVEDGVGAGETWSIYIDDFDMVWVGTFNGGACLFDGEVWNCLDSRDGLINNTISAIHGTNGNKVWLASWNGITTYVPKRELSNVYLKQVITPQKIFSGNDLTEIDYSIIKGNRITFQLNSNSFNTLEEKQKYKLKIKHNGIEKDTLIKTNKFDYIGKKTGNYSLEFQSIDRDLNTSKPENVKFSVVGPWYINPSTAVPFWGFIAVLLSFSGYTSNRYLKQRKLALNLKEESQKKDREARERLEGKNAELLESQKAAEAANEAKSTFLANMSHELRTPLNAIIGYSEMLIEDAEDENEDFIPDLDKINNSGKHLLGLINDILDLSKVESGKMELYLESFELEKVISEIESTIKPLIEKNKNSLKIEYVSNEKTMKADVTKVRQILLNLLSNSAKFTKEGEISITVSNSESLENAIDFTVADTGIGMTPDQVEKVFKPFTQADEKTTRKFGGTGLGLTITKMFAEMMGGNIEIQSKEGNGTTFVVTIPLNVVDLSKEKIDLNDKVSEDAGYTILVIDDDDNAQDMMKKFLEKQDFTVLQAKNGEDGLKLAAEFMPDAITLDVMMPEMDGWEVLAALQANEVTKNIPVIMLTISNEPDIGYSLGATDYLTKPVNWDELSTILKKHQIESDSQSILIVEDDEITRDMLSKSLETNQFKVKTAVNGKEALDKIRSSKPGLILLDLMMPEMDGFEFAERLRENKEWLNIPVVVITAKDLTKEDHARLKGNVETIMQKGSYNRNELLSEVTERIKKITER